MKNPSKTHRSSHLLSFSFLPFFFVVLVVVFFYVQLFLMLFYRALCLFSFVSLHYTHISNWPSDARPGTIFDVKLRDEGITNEQCPLSSIIHKTFFVFCFLSLISLSCRVHRRHFKIHNECPGDLLIALSPHGGLHRPIV